MRTTKVFLMVKHGISRFPCQELLHMPGTTTTPGRRSTRDIALLRLAFPLRNSVGTRNEYLSGLNSWPVDFPADASPVTLASDDARLGADAVHSTVIVSDLHQLLLAALPAPSAKNVLRYRFT